ncbi:unnamed protein product [Rodentolepis nana]|uniref:SH3_10 domain-containing protein n=1 Tax=Rodentolepis nana TaxID=102285 RepID=A0A158QGH5_RODNA|nr:unnamed protein product [Rodentolepis nana]
MGCSNSKIVEFNVGVSHLALDEERERYTRIRERIESIIDGFNKKKAATGNTETLRYLESISCLESIFTDVTKAATVTAVGLSSEDNISQRVFESRLLTNSVKQCWGYTAQLSNLTAIHLKSAADFHIFYHEINEIRAQATQMKAVSDTQVEAFSPYGRITEASSLDDEMKVRLNTFQDLAERARTLVSKAPSILPVENRLTEVRNGVAKDFEGNGPLMVQMLIDYVGSSYNVSKGDSLALLDTTENPYLWKVMTKNGPQYVPSIACIIASANGEQVHDAYRTLATVKESWNEALDNYRRQLAIYYTKYLQNIVNGRGLYITDIQAKKQFIEDLNRLLIQSGADEGRLLNVLDMLTSKIVGRADQADEVWSRGEVDLLHQPLIALYEHIKSLRNMDESVEPITSSLKDYDLTLTHDRNRAEMKDLYDRVHNWRSIYAASLDKPPDGVGRLVVSSISSSSGVSSLEGPPVPLPPSPLGRITPTEAEEEFEFLETRPRRPRMNVAVLNTIDEPPKSKVFTCGANITQRQIPTSVKVVDIEKPKMIRDVATNTPGRRTIKNTQTDMSGDTVKSKFASTQSERNRVDCMTQIGWVMAQKTQQVDDSIISAGLEVNERVPSIASATDGATPDKVQINFTTGPPKAVLKQDLMFQIGDSRQLRRNSEDFEVEKDSLDSEDFAAHISTRTFNFETNNRGTGIITQIDQFSQKIDRYTQPEAIEVGMIPKLKTSIQMNSGELVTGKQEFTRAWNNTNLQTECDIGSLQFETVPQPIKSFDAGAQIFYPPKAHGVVDGSINQAEYGQQIYTEESNKETETRNFIVSGEYSGINRHPMQYASENFARDTSYCTLNTDDRRLSDIDMQFCGSKILHTFVVNERKLREVDYKVSRYGRCETPKIEVKIPELRTSGCQVGMKLIPREIRVSALPVGVSDKTVAEKLELPMNSILCPASISCQPTLTEEAGVQLVDVKDVDSVQIQTDKRSYLAGVQSAKPKRALSLARTAPQETCLIEFKTDPQEMKSGSVNFVKSTTDRSTFVPRVFTEAECQFKVTDDLTTATSLSESTYPTLRGMKPNQRHESCQVGTVLLPETMEVSTVPLNITDIDQTEQRNIVVDSVICPTKVKVRPVLTEDAGIHIAKTMDLQQMNVKIDEKVYNATVSTTPKHHSGEIEVTGQQICKVEMECGEGHNEIHTMTVSPGVTEGGVTINIHESRRQQEIANKLNCPSCHCLLETSWSTSETTSYNHKPITKATQVGAVLKPVKVQVMDVSMHSKASPKIRSFTTDVPNIICPSTVELVSTLVESSGISVRDISEVSNVSIVRGVSSFYANIRNDSAETSTMNPLVQQGYGEALIEVKRPDDTGLRVKPILQHAKFEIVDEITNKICEVCNGTGNRLVSNSNSSLGKTTSYSYTSYQPIAHRKSFGVKEVSNMEVVTGSTPCEANLNTKSNEDKKRNIPESRPFMNNVTIASGQSGLAIGKITDTSQRAETLTRNEVGYRFPIKVVTKEMDSNQEPADGESITLINARKPRMQSVETQVGAILKPTRAYIANVQIQPRTSEIAKQISMSPDAIIFPSSIELSTQLSENAGIQVVDVKNVSNMEVVAGSSIFETSFVSRRSAENVHIPTRLPVKGNMNIMVGRTGLTLGKEGTNRQVSSDISNNETFVLQDIGCDFAIKNTSVGAICAHCHGTGRVERSTSAFSSSSSPSMDLSRKPSFIHQRASTPLSKSTECQVGVTLRPKSIQLASISVRPRDKAIASYLGLKVDSILCPASLQVISEIGETSGIELLEIKDESCIKIQAGDALLDADLESRASDASSMSSRKTGIVMSLKSGSGVFTLGRSISQVPDHSPSESFRLKDAGCEIVLRDTGAGRICTSCQGTGRMTTTSIKSFIPFESSNFGQKSPFESTTMVNRSARCESKSCQVGMILTPTNVNIASIEMLPRNISSAVASGSVVYPSTVDLTSRLMEISGIQIKEVANTDDVTFSKDSEKFVSSIVRTSHVPETCILEVRSANPISRGKFSLQKIGCEFRLKEVGTNTSPSTGKFSSVHTFEASAPAETRLEAISDSKVKHASSQVGLSLVPKTVQVADMSATASDKRVANNLGLKADALICPSSVDLEMKLTETGGVSIIDIKDIREVAVRVGENRGVISITGRNMKTVNMASKLTDVSLLTFTCNKPSVPYLGTRPPLGKPFESTTTMVNKRFDQNARCTFRLSESSETVSQLISSSKCVTKREAGCQVGVLMVPKIVKVSTVRMAPEDKASSNTMGVAKPSTLQASTCEFEPRISEKIGIQIAQVDAIQEVQLEISGQIYTAAVNSPRGAISSPWNSKPIMTSITGFPISGTRSPSLSHRKETNGSNVVGPYLLSLKDGSTQKQGIVEVVGLTLGGKVVQLSVNADLRDKLPIQSDRRGDRGFKGYYLSSPSPSSSSERYHPNRPNSRLCDVACEALIKPETLEKRLQTLFI